MTIKTLDFLKNTCWIIASIGMFFLLLDNKKNNPLTATIFVFAIAGVIFNLIADKRKKK